jgi:hypothetical protein
MYTVIPLILAALISGALFAIALRFANEAFELGMDSGDPYALGIPATLVCAGLGAFLHFALGVPAMVLPLLVPVVAVVIIGAAALCIWFGKIGAIKLDQFVVAKGRLMRERMQDFNHDRNA